MRIRQVKPAYFKDERIAALTPAVRLFYIGLWMLADDAGYLRWNPAEAGLELYGFESRKRRERDVTAYLDVLVAADRVERYDCGHIYIPTLTDHQRFSGPDKRFRAFEREHAGCPPVPATPRRFPRVTAPVGNGNGTVRELETERKGTGTVIARAQENDEPTEFQVRVPRPA